MTPRPDPVQLRAAWLALMADLTPDESHASAAFAEIERRYAEPHRAYHTLAHVWQVLQDVQWLAIYARKLHQVQVAAWLHDVVYDPRAADNEERSARFAVDLLQSAHLPHAFISGVKRLILLTRHHETAADDRDGCVLLDADLAILGASTTAYRQYARAIRREYAWVQEADYCSGRIAVLRRFLQRPFIYQTPLMRNEREEAARENLQAEITHLTGRPGPWP